MFSIFFLEKRDNFKKIQIACRPAKPAVTRRRRFFNLVAGERKLMCFLFTAACVVLWLTINFWINKSKSKCLVVIPLHAVSHVFIQLDYFPLSWNQPSSVPICLSSHLKVSKWKEDRESVSQPRRLQHQHNYSVLLNLEYPSFYNLTRD